MSNSNSDDTSHYEGAILEEIRDNVKQLAESTSGLAHKVNAIDQRLGNVEADVGLLKAVTKGVNAQLNKIEANTEPIPAMTAVVTEHSDDIDELKLRVTKLEKRAA